MKSWLDLAYQLEEIDYSPKNFIHADMSPEEFSRVMSERGESFLQMMMRAMGAAMAQQSVSGRSTDFELFFALGASDRSLRLKRIMSTQFKDLETSMKAIEGEKGSTIIGQRNKKALDVLANERLLLARNALAFSTGQVICRTWKNEWQNDSKWCLRRIP